VHHVDPHQGQPRALKGNTTLGLRLARGEPTDAVPQVSASVVSCSMYIPSLKGYTALGLRLAPGELALRA
jgi:hypothetical protein